MNQLIPPASENHEQKQFFEFAGPLYSVRISPASSVVSVGTSRNFRAICRDRNKRLVEGDLSFSWKIAEGKGSLGNSESEIVTFAASDEPGLTRIILTVTQENQSCSAEGLITVTESLLPKSYDKGAAKKGLPGYTFRRASGELWRSRYDETQNIIVVNNGHRDFVYASKNKARKLRYICRLFAKELVYKNFPGIPADQLLERMIELTLYTEDYLK